MSTAAPQLKRGGILPYILIPQVIVLAFFILSRATVWGGILSGATSLSGFFFELVSVGAGWAMFSIGALMFSVVHYYDEDFHRLSELLQNNAFNDFDAKTFVAMVAQSNNTQGTLGYCIWPTAVLVSFAALFSFFGAGQMYSVPMEAALSFPALFGTGLAIVSAVRLIPVGPEGNIPLSEILESGFGYWRQLSSERVMELTSLLNSERLNDEQIREYLAEQLERRKKHMDGQ